MKNLRKFFLAIILTTIYSCSNNRLSYNNPDAKILFLHHSTGMNVWKGEIKGLAKFTKRLGPSLVPELLKEYNKLNGKKYSITQRRFPTHPYTLENFPYDYYNIWAKHAGNEPYMKNPTLEMLTTDYDVIVFKHCYPFSEILADDSIPDINSDKKTIANYTLQYNALKNKLKEFPNTKFILWTGAALVEGTATEEAKRAKNFEKAKRAKDFCSWVTDVWDTPGDNIYIFDFRKIETDGGLFLKPEYAVGIYDSHPNEVLSIKAAELFVKRIVEVIEKQ